MYIMAKILNKLTQTDEDIRKLAHKILDGIISEFTKKSDSEIGVILPGQGFGEQAMIHNTARTVTFKCSHDCKLVKLSREDYFLTIGRVQRKIFEKLIDFIKDCPGFENLSKSSIARLLLMWHEKKYYRNQLVFK